MAILDFSASGRHGFGSVTQVCFGISVSNFMYMSFVAVGRSLTNVSYVAFKMAALWFWTMFNCNPPIAYCHPFLWGGGILVDHWSTISSFYWSSLSFYMCLQHLPLYLTHKNYIVSYDAVSILNTDIVKDHFTKKLSMIIQIRWKFYYVVIQTLMNLLLKMLVCGTTAVLSWHVLILVG